MHHSMVCRALEAKSSGSGKAAALSLVLGTRARRFSADWRPVLSSGLLSAACRELSNLRPLRMWACLQVFKCKLQLGKA